MNQYASYAGTVDTFRRQQSALERLRPLFEHLEKHFDETQFRKRRASAG